MKYLKFVLIIVSSTYLNGNAQQIRDSIYNANIKTIQLYKKGWELSYPIITLNSDEKLVLGFDDLSKNIKSYYYTLIHCDSEWEVSNLNYSEYCDGFEQNQFNKPLFSTNTTVNYIHYSLIIPNENCTPLISGNYILKVFEDLDQTKLVFTKRLYIVENTANIDLLVLRPEISKYMMKYQQYRIKVTPNIPDFTDLKTEIKTVAIQNFNTSYAQECYLSTLADNILHYEDLDSNLFEGGNEYRNFDIKSLKYQSPHIQYIEFKDSIYNIVLHPEEWRNKKQYFTDIDLNGNYYIENKAGVIKERDADYFNVHFELPNNGPFVDGDLYIYGALSYWQCNKTNKMNYNFNKRAYELNLLLKQGYYNYQIAYVSKDNNKIDLSFAEGNHYETENDYLVLVYYKSAIGRYERLIGYQKANSLNK